MTLALENWTTPAWIGSFLINLMVFTIPLVLMELWQHRTQDRLVSLKLSRLPKALLHGVLLLGIIMFWQKEEMPFIYFQF